MSQRYADLAAFSPDLTNGTLANLPGPWSWECDGTPGMGNVSSASPAAAPDAECWHGYGQNWTTAPSTPVPSYVSVGTFDPASGAAAAKLYRHPVVVELRGGRMAERSPVALRPTPIPRPVCGSSRRGNVGPERRALSLNYAAGRLSGAGGGGVGAVTQIGSGWEWFCDQNPGGPGNGNAQGELHDTIHANDNRFPGGDTHRCGRTNGPDYRHNHIEPECHQFHWEL